MTGPAGSTASENFFLDGALEAFDLAVEAWCTRSDAGVADTEAAQEGGELAAELGAVVCLDTAQREADVRKQPREDGADLCLRPFLENASSSHPATVIDQSDLEEALWRVLE